MSSVPLPDRIGPYEIRERIGEGGMATVYKAWHTNLHRFEALKVPRPGYGDGEYIQRLLVEARIAARLHHPHIVTIHAISELDATQHFFAMDYVEGLDLEDLLERRGVLPPNEALGILEQIASALDYAHAHGVIHRDIKPGNILLREAPEKPIEARWNVKVADFGISRAAEDTDGTRLTKSGMLVGTPEYMSPEQAGSGEVVDYRTDLYSLCVLAYEMLTGRPPFTAGDGVSRMSILMSHVAHPPKPPREIVPEIPPEVDDAIVRGLAKKPTERFPSGAAWMRAARGLAEELPPVAANIRAGAERTPFDSEAPRLGKAQLNEEKATTPISIPTVFTPSSLPATDVTSPVSVTSVSSRAPRKLSGVALGVGVLSVVILGGIFNTLRPRRAEIETIPISNVASDVASNIAPDVATPAPETTPASTSVAPVPSPTTQPTPTPQTRIVTEQREIPFERQARRTRELTVGRSRIVQTGGIGTREVKLQITSSGDGANKRELSRRVLVQKVVVEPRAQITEIGTRAIVREVPSRPRRRIVRETPTRPRRIARPVVRRPVVRPSRPTVRRPREAPLPP